VSEYVDTLTRVGPAAGGAERDKFVVIFVQAAHEQDFRESLVGRAPRNCRPQSRDFSRS
jgi:hypothetical protein